MDMDDNGVGFHADSRDVIIAIIIITIYTKLFTAQNAAQIISRLNKKQTTLN